MPPRYPGSFLLAYFIRDMIAATAFVVVLLAVLK